MMRRRRPLTSRGAGALVAALSCLIAANLFGARILAYVGVLLIFLVVFSLLAVRLPRRSGVVSRQVHTDLLTVGAKSRVTVRLTLRTWRVPPGLWHDMLPPALSGDASGEYSGDTAPLSYEATGIRRGVWPLGPLMLRTVDPFGLAQREQAFGEPRSVTVVPEVLTLTSAAVRVGAAGGTAHTSSTRLGQGSDNLSPRPYIPGDSMRRIHWRATAHRDKLMVRQEEEESSPDAVVVLDRSSHRWDTPGPDIDPNFEAAVSLCASSAMHLASEGYSVDVIDSAGSLFGSLRGQEDDRDNLLVALAQVAPRGVSRELPALLGGTPPGPLIYITGNLHEEDARRLHPAGAAAPLLFAATLPPRAVDNCRRHGWTVTRVDTDIATAWEDAIASRIEGGDVAH